MNRLAQPKGKQMTYYIIVAAILMPAVFATCVYLGALAAEAINIWRRK